MYRCFSAEVARSEPPRVEGLGHGKKENKNSVLVGGRHGTLAEDIVERLREAGFVAERITSGPVSGTEKSNICNRTATGKGVQLEIYRDLRELLGHESSSRLNEFAYSIRRALLAHLKSLR